MANIWGKQSNAGSANTYDTIDLFLEKEKEYYGPCNSDDPYYGNYHQRADNKISTITNRITNYY